MNYEKYASSEQNSSGTTFYLAHTSSGEKVLVVQGDTAGFYGTLGPDGAMIAPLTHENAHQLRSRLPWLNPVPLGLCTSAGFGDRLGLATPGHVLAVQGTRIAPIFAQQSVRENNRTHRTPQEVMDDALWGVFQGGWDQPWGADADHLRQPEDIPAFVAAGYTFYTVDPGGHVDNAALTDDLDVLSIKFNTLPWDQLRASPESTLQAYTRAPIRMPGLALEFDSETLLRSAVKYGNAVAHAANMYAQLKAACGPDKGFELEVSLDETDQPTSLYDHYYVANELSRLGIPFVSLALRFPGLLAKGVDYIGDLATFEVHLAGHTLIQQSFNTYKLSLHSGSDKFSLYPLFARYCPERFHLKTAGTSYLEALRVFASVDRTLFHKILALAVERYETDRTSYHVSGRLDRLPPLDSLADGDLPGLLEQVDARQILHVTFGSALDQFGPEICATLRVHESEYTADIHRHFQRHLQPFLKLS